MGPKDSAYETFDSGSGPTIPEGEGDSFDHMDDGSGSYTSNEVTGLDLEVPETPSTKR